MKRRVKLLILAAAILVVLVIILFSIFAARRPQRRHAMNRGTQTAAQKNVKAKAPGVPLQNLPLQQWTNRILTLQNSGDWETLDGELDAIAQAKRAEYDRFHLDYLHARTKIETGDLDAAATRLQKFIVAGNQFRELALYHLAEVADAGDDDKAASQYRLQLIREYLQSSYRDEAIEDHLGWLDEHGSIADFNAFRSLIYAGASSELRRELDSRLIARELREHATPDAINRGIQLLRGNSGDDPSDRVLVALDRPEITASLPPDALLLMGESAKDHRHFDRSVALLQMAKPKVPPDKQDDVAFSIGRSQFGAEKYGEAEATYLAGASQTRDLKMKATFFFHASRAAQLRGDDATAEREMTQALAVPGKFPATSAALTQRMRTRLHQKRWGEAAADLQQIRVLFPKDHAVVEATLSHALAALAAGRAGEADGELAAIPKNLLEKFEGSEISYWRGRANEKINPDAAITHYLAVLRSAEPTHFAYFARERLQQPAFAAAVTKIVNARRAAAANALAKKDYGTARVAQTDVVLLHPDDTALETLRQIYLQLPAYAAVVKLQPSPFPELRADGPPQSRGETLLALGLFDEATDEIKRRYPLRPASPALAQSLALNRASASKESILAIEILMKSVPSDFVPELLPRVVLELLYPRYFYDAIEHDTKRFNADPRLVVSIMREESRFNPRAKSVAAARGLLQFIITTARDVAHAVGIAKLAPNDLYDPRTIIELGAKYIGDLLATFDHNPYRAAAAYNAGPNQTKLWNRLAPEQGNDYFLSSINFDETKHYVRKVLNSYWRYGEIYEDAKPAGGVRPEP